MSDIGKFTFSAEYGDHTTTVSLNAESPIDAVLTAFRTFLLASGFAPETVDEAFAAEVAPPSQDANPNETDQAGARRAAAAVKAGFLWSNTPQGFDYWDNVVTNLERIAEGQP